MNGAPAPAKINLALVVGPIRDDGKHEVVTALQRVGLSDSIAVTAAADLEVAGYFDDTIVRRGLEELAREAGIEPRWLAQISKSIPVAAGLGGGSSDAATAIRLANETLPAPLTVDELLTIAARIGADVPFFLRPGPQLGTGDGSTLEPLSLPQDYWIVLVLPDGLAKTATGDVYKSFDDRAGASGFSERRTALLEGLAGVRDASDLAGLPTNDLASSPLSADLVARGAFRADVSGAGPTVYGLFQHRRDADAAALALQTAGRTWVTAPVRDL